jgi:hypothetical protein
MATDFSNRSKRILDSVNYDAQGYVLRQGAYARNAKTDDVRANQDRVLLYNLLITLLPAVLIAADNNNTKVQMVTAAQDAIDDGEQLLVQFARRRSQ